MMGTLSTGRTLMEMAANGNDNYCRAINYLFPSFAAYDASTAFMGLYDVLSNSRGPDWSLFDQHKAEVYKDLLKPLIYNPQIRTLTNLDFDSVFEPGPGFMRPTAGADPMEVAKEMLDTILTLPLAYSDGSEFVDANPPVVEATGIFKTEWVSWCDSIQKLTSAGDSYGKIKITCVDKRENHIPSNPIINYDDITSVSVQYTFTEKVSKYLYLGYDINTQKNMLEHATSHEAK
jgi:hypothetical protein